MNITECLRYATPYDTGTYLETFLTLKKEILPCIPLYLNFPNKKPEKIASLSKNTQGKFQGTYVHLQNGIQLSYPLSELFIQLRVKDLYDRYRPFVYREVGSEGVPKASIFLHPNRVLLVPTIEVQRGDFIFNGRDINQLTVIPESPDTRDFSVWLASGEKVYIDDKTVIQFAQGNE